MGIAGAWPRDVLGWRRQLDVDPSGGEEVASGPPQLLGPRREPSTGRHYQAHRLPSRSGDAGSCGGYRSPFDGGPLPLRGLGGAVGAIPASSRAVRPESAHRRCLLCLLHIRQRAEFGRQCGDPRRWEPSWCAGEPALVLASDNNHVGDVVAGVLRSVAVAQALALVVFCSLCYRQRGLVVGRPLRSLGCC
jgi:hypothetical protein